MAFSANATNDFLTGRKPVPNPAGIELIAQRFAVTLATADLALNTVGLVGILPAGCVPVAFELDAAQLDSNGTPTLAYSVGIANAGQTDISTAAADGGAAWATAQTTGRTAGGSASGLVGSRPMKTVTQAQTDRYLMVKVTAAAATAVAGELGITLWYRAAPM